MNRFPDWPERLANIIETRRKAGFLFGSNDCCTWAADVVLALTGDDPAAEYRGTYDDERGALQLIRDAGGMRGLVNLPEKHPGLAQRGDVVLAVVESRETFGIADVGGWWAPGVDGLVFRPMSDVFAAFEV